jgi:hypothetical protein
VELLIDLLELLVVAIRKTALASHIDDKQGTAPTRAQRSEVEWGSVNFVDGKVVNSGTRGGHFKQISLHKSRSFSYDVTWLVAHKDEHFETSQFHIFIDNGGDAAVCEDPRHVLILLGVIAAYVPH